MRMPSALLALVALVVVVAGGADARPSAPRGVVDDVRALGQSIETIHPAPFRSIPRERFRAEVDTLARRAPSISRNELLVGVLRLIALLGPRNGHTGLFPGDSAHTQPLHLYPLRLYHFADGVFVVDARDTSLVRNRLVAIEGTPVERVLELVEPLTPHDNPMNVRGMAPHYLLTAEVLDGLGITDGAGPADFTFARPEGQSVDVTLTPMTGPQYAAVRRFASRALPIGASTRVAADVPRGQRQGAVVSDARGRTRGVRRLQLGRSSALRGPSAHRASRQGEADSPGDRRRSPERRGRQHDVW